MSNASHAFSNGRSYPEIARFGYRVVRELGRNRQGGRVTYLAETQSTQELVVVKQFQFAQTNSNWADYDAYEREVQLLRELNHPSIPRYIDSFETTAGFCLVQEYKQAASLAQIHDLTVLEIRQIAIAVLKVLVYLQQRIPPVIHRDLKPENILFDRQTSTVYLIDFGFAHTTGEVAASSVVKGTLGFMPPEQLFNRQLTPASDLYSLGATLICLLTQTPSTQIGLLIDEDYHLNFKSRLANPNSRFGHWLEKMVAPNPKYRYPNAAAALAALPSNPRGSRFGLVTQHFHALPATAGAVRTVSVLVLASTGLTLLQHLPLMLSAPPYPTLHSSQFHHKIPMEAIPDGPNLKGANLSGRDLRSVNLSGADLTGADLSGCDLRLADLSSAKLTGANLQDADLRNADLTNADLTGANLADADLRQVDLSTAQLAGANLSGVDLRDAQLPGFWNSSSLDPEQRPHRDWSGRDRPGNRDLPPPRYQ